MDAAVRLYHKREREQIDRFFNALERYNKTGKYEHFENTNAEKIWFWAIKRWRYFPHREYEIRTEGENND